MDLLTYEMDFPTVMYGVLLIHYITDLFTNNSLTKVPANYVIDMIKHIGIVDQLNRNHKISNTKTALITISTNSNLTIAVLSHSSTKHISISCKNNSN